MKGCECEKAELTLTLSITRRLDHDDYVDVIDSVRRYVKQQIKQKARRVMDFQIQHEDIQYLLLC